YHLQVNFFFFSSRRRHTRFSRDWSSDVCSSDLQPRRRHRRRHAADPARRDAGVPAAAAPTGGGTVTHVSQAREHTVKPVRRFVRRPGRLAAETAALLTAAVVAFPLYWMVLGAFKPAGEIESTEPRP